MIEPKKQIPELGIESKLLYKLNELGYKQRTDIKTDKYIERNIKYHLERLEWLKDNKLKNETLSDVEFQTYVINIIKNMDVYSAAKKFRDIFIVKRPNRQNVRLACFDLENFDNNIFEFTDYFLNKETLFKLITKYIVFEETNDEIYKLEKEIESIIPELMEVK